MAEFTIEVMDNRAVYTGSDFYSGEDTVHFDFQGEWANATNKKAIFEAYNRVMVEIDSDGNCAVPAFTNPGKVEVYVVADGLMTTSPAVIREKAEQPSAGGVSGGDLFVVNVTKVSSGEWTCTTDYAGLAAAVEAKKTIVGNYYKNGEVQALKSVSAPNEYGIAVMYSSDFIAFGKDDGYIGEEA